MRVMLHKPSPCGVAGGLAAEELLPEAFRP